MALPAANQRLLSGLFETVFHQKVQVVPLVEDLAFDVGIELTEAPDLAVLLRDQTLVERGDLDEKVVRRKVEIGSEFLDDLAVLVPFDVERARLVFPIDLVEVEELRELALRVVREADSLALLTAVEVVGPWVRDDSVPSLRLGGNGGALPLVLLAARRRSRAVGAGSLGDPEL